MGRILHYPVRIVALELSLVLMRMGVSVAAKTAKEPMVGFLAHCGRGRGGVGCGGGGGGHGCEREERSKSIESLREWE